MAQLRAERIAAREAAEQNVEQGAARAFDRLAQRADNLAENELRAQADCAFMVSRFMTVSATSNKRRASRNLRACYGHIIIACTLGTGMMALLISARGRYKNECKDIALPRYPNRGDAGKYKRLPSRR